MEWAIIEAVRDAIEAVEDRYGRRVAWVLALFSVALLIGAPLTLLFIMWR